LFSKQCFDSKSETNNKKIHVQYPITEAFTSPIQFYLFKQIIYSKEMKY